MGIRALGFSLLLFPLGADEGEGSPGVGTWGPAAAWPCRGGPPGPVRGGFCLLATRLLRVPSPGSGRQWLCGGGPSGPRWERGAAGVGAALGALEGSGERALGSPLLLPGGPAQRCAPGTLAAASRAADPRDPAPTGGLCLPRLEILGAARGNKVGVGNL